MKLPQEGLELFSGESHATGGQVMAKKKRVPSGVEVGKIGQLASSQQRGRSISSDLRDPTENRTTTPI